MHGLLVERLPGMLSRAMATSVPPARPGLLYRLAVAGKTRLRNFIRFRCRPAWLRMRLGLVRRGAGAQVQIGRRLSLGRGVRVYLLPGGELEIGEGARLHDGVVLVIHQGARLSIGRGVYVGPGGEIHARERVEIGAGCLLAGQVTVIDHDHVFDLVSPVREKEISASAVTIGEGCWLATRVVVARGATIGRHSVIGAGAVVTTEIPEGSVAGGVPARVVRSGPGNAAD